MAVAYRADTKGVVGALSGVVGVAAFAYLMAYPRVLGRVDESVVLYGARRILEGQALYKDFFEFITPGSFYFFAAVFAATGPSLLGARAAMAAANAVSCVLLFVLARRVAGTAEACLVVLLFAVTCLPVWPYASPHWLSTLLCLATAAVLLSEPWEGATSARAGCVGVLAGLTFCVQQQCGVLLGLWVVAAIVALAYLSAPPERWRRCRGQLTWTGGGWLAVTLAILGYSVWQASAGRVLDSILVFVFRNYYPAVHGSAPSLRMPWAGVCMLCGGFVPYTWLGMLRTLPLILAGEVMALVWTLRRYRGRPEVVRLCVVLLAAAMSVSVLYYPDFIHVTFVAPFLLIVAARVAYGLRTMPLWRSRRWLQAAFGMALAVAVGVVVRKGRTNLDYAWSQAPEQFDSAVGTLRGTEADRKLLEAVRAVLNRVPSGPRTLFSYPADTWLYLAAPANDPTPFALLYPGYNTPAQFQAALTALERQPADCLVVNSAFAGAADPVMRFQAGRYQRVMRVGLYGVYGRNG